ncbi:hypothetical protein [Nonomuraea angiospora]
MGVVRRRLALRVVRGFLLVLLALGVCGMHTLGHLDGGHGGTSSDVHGMGVVQEPVPMAPAGLRAFVPEHDMPGFDPTDVCLAVLTSFMVMMMLAAWIKAWRRTGGRGWSRPPVRQVARPPPKTTSLRLASLSMLRI